jgi:four helix bundle protein
MRNNRGYRKLIAWMKSNLLAHLIYDITKKFPEEEIFGLTLQMRRAALSVSANIVEGYSRQSLKDRRHFYQIAISSLAELEFFIDFAYERKYMKTEDHQLAVNLHTETARILNGLIKSVKIGNQD